MGSLLVGLSFAKGLSLAHHIPLVGVNHMDAHIYANTIEHNLEFPLIALTVSGGHTQLTKLSSPYTPEIISQTRDDAAGEAFDKIGKLLGLNYPAGPKIDVLSREGNPYFHEFPKGSCEKGWILVFLVLKPVFYTIFKVKMTHLQPKISMNICASVSHAITEVLDYKTRAGYADTFHPSSSVGRWGLSKLNAERKGCRYGRGKRLHYI